MSLHALLIALTLLVATGFGQTPVPLAALNANFTGDWAGTLEYRDFQTNAQTLLPTWLTLTPAADGKTIRLHYTYDDGPTKTVVEDATLAFDPTAGKAALSSGKVVERYAVQGLTEFVRSSLGTLTLLGSGIESGHPVEIRLTLTLRRNLYLLRKETRSSGEDFKFRDAYTFTRIVPPKT